MKFKVEALEPSLGKGESASTEVREEKIRIVTKLQKKNTMNEKKNNHKSARTEYKRGAEHGEKNVCNHNPLPLYNLPLSLSNTPFFPASVSGLGNFRLIIRCCCCGFFFGFCLPFPLLFQTGAFFLFGLSSSSSSPTTPPAASWSPFPALQIGLKLKVTSQAQVVNKSKCLFFSLWS